MASVLAGFHSKRWWLSQAACSAFHCWVLSTTAGKFAVLVVLNPLSSQLQIHSCWVSWHSGQIARDTGTFPPPYAVFAEQAVHMAKGELELSVRGATLHVSYPSEESDVVNCPLCVYVNFPLKKKSQIDEVGLMLLFGLSDIAQVIFLWSWWSP